MHDFIRDFQATIEKSSAALRTISETESALPRSPGKWSPKQIIGHLIDSACNNHRRFILAQLQDDLVFPGYDQEAWVQLQQYQQAQWLSLIELWRTYNLQLAHVMAAVPEEIRKRPHANHSLDQIAWRAVPKSRPATLEYLMVDYIEHLKHHLNQILDK